MIYTKTGDKGTSSLASGERVSKTDARLEAYGTADELNSFVGWLKAKICTDGMVQSELTRVQNVLFNLGAELSDAPGEWVTKEDIKQIESWIDGIQAELEPLRAFILPEGSESIGLCHVCRTVTRRLERRMIAMGSASESACTYVNRLSDYFFVLSRKIAKVEKIEPQKWQK